jgi:hypothetical protein
VVHSTVPLTPILQAQRAVLATQLADRGGDPSRSLAASSEAWQAIRKAWGEGHPLTLEIGLVYADHLEQSGRSNEARELVKSIAGLATAFADQAPVRRTLAHWNRMPDAR